MINFRRLVLAGWLALFASLLSFGGRQAYGEQPAQPSSDLILYDDALQNGFTDTWSFDITFDTANTSPTYNGSAHSVRVQYNSGNWGGWWLRREAGDINLSNYTAVQFAIHGGSMGGQQLRVQADSGTNYPTHEVELSSYLPGGPVADEWRVVTIPLSDLNMTDSTLGTLAFQSDVNTGQPAFYLDDIRLVAGAPPPPPPPLNANIQVQTTRVIARVNPKLLGTNLPAWLGSNLTNSTLRARTIASGARALRLPGGSWSDDYGWLSCEMRANQAGAYPCGSGWESWAARPTDFINFVRGTGKQPMWTVNVNITSKEAAALVAFMNGSPSDSRAIGTDIHGTDWLTVGYWAQLRVDHGNAQPLGIKLWEFGNEIYGGDPSGGGKDCVSWGWEHAWTCDGSEYINGVGTGSTRHEGYLEFRNAMRAVDPTIRLGAVGTEDPSAYSNWGNEVIAGAGSVLDFYIVHPYAYDNLPSNDPNGYAQILAQPLTHWREMKTNLQSAFNTYAGGRKIPIFATEYNLVCCQDNDPNRLMTRAVDALFIADSIGQAIQNGYAGANQWDLSGGTASNGTSYDLLQVVNGFYRAPQYYAFPLWSRFGKKMLPVSSSLDAATQFSVYAGRINASTYSLLAINKTASVVKATITFDGGVTISSGTADVVKASSLGATSVRLNGVLNPADDLSNAPSRSLSQVGSSFVYSFRPYSITLLRMTSQ